MPGYITSRLPLSASSRISLDDWIMYMGVLASVQRIIRHPDPEMIDISIMAKRHPLMQQRP